eukprot:29565-Pelagococcus_subviridis.AAC.22
MAHVRLDVPKLHALVPRRGQEPVVAMTPRDVEYRVIVREPLLRRAVPRLDFHPGQGFRRVHDRHDAFLVRDGEESIPAPTRVVAKFDHERRRAVAHVRGDDSHDPAPRVAVPAVGHEVADARTERRGRAETRRLARA